jgi:rRNA biogenesis protein RRP5
MIHIKTLSATQSFWLNYMTFLMTTANKPDEARSLLRRATQSVPENEHRSLTAKLGALEFRSPNGDAERGRTIFEGLLSTFPKQGDLWDIYVDLEKSFGHRENARKLYERMGNSRMKKKRAKFVFKKWLAFEHDMGQGEDIERVTKLAKNYVKKLYNDETNE